MGENVLGKRWTLYTTPLHFRIHAGSSGSEWGLSRIAEMGGSQGSPSLRTMVAMVISGLSSSAKAGVDTAYATAYAVAIKLSGIIVFKIKACTTPLSYNYIYREQITSKKLTRQDNIVRVNMA